MQTFREYTEIKEDRWTKAIEWLATNGHEINEHNIALVTESWGKTLGTMALGGALALGANRFISRAPTTPNHDNAPVAASTQTPQTGKIVFDFGGPRKCHVEIDGERGTGELKFLAGHLDISSNGGIADKYITKAILKASEMQSGKIIGLQKGISTQGNWVVAHFSWESVE